MTPEQLKRLRQIRYYRRYAGLRELVSDVEALQAAYDAAVAELARKEPA